MTMAPFDASEYEIDNYFSKMRELKEEYEKKYDYVIVNKEIEKACNDLINIINL